MVTTNETKQTESPTHHRIQILAQARAALPPEMLGLAQGRCEPNCPGAALGNGRFTGCSCAEGLLANGNPTPAGFECDCPNHPAPEAA
jgi:hypothetical protein